MSQGLHARESTAFSKPDGPSWPQKDLNVNENALHSNGESIASTALHACVCILHIKLWRVGLCLLEARQLNFQVGTLAGRCPAAD